MAFRRRFKRNYKKKRRYGKVGFRKMRKGRSMFGNAKRYRSGRGRSQVEQKSFDLAVNSTILGNNDPFANAQTLANWVPYGGVGAWAAGPGAANIGNFFSFSSGSSIITAANQATGDPGVCLNAMAQGADILNRLGRKVTIRSLYVRMTVMCPGTWAYTAGPPILWTHTQTAANCTGACRLLIVYDKQGSGYGYSSVGPTYGALYKNEVLAALGTAGQPGAAQQGLLGCDATMNLGNRERFVVLYDKTVTLDGIMKKSHCFYFYKKLRLPVVYNNINITNANPWCNIQSGAIWAFGISDAAVDVSPNQAAAPPVKVPMCHFGIVRTRFEDA